MAGCNCGRRWTGLAQAHCMSCHEHFGSVRGFDRHRPKGHCLNPEPMTRRDGRALYREDAGPYGITWVLHTDRVHPGHARRLAEEDAA
jgi:hypothetical protein